MTWPITGAMVRSWAESDEPPTPSLELAVAAVVAYVPKIPGLARFWTGPGGEFKPDDDVMFGAIMLASRLHARRGALLGEASGYTEFGVQTILRQDPDIARMLRIGSAAGGLVFGAPSLPVDEVAL